GHHDLSGVRRLRLTRRAIGDVDVGHHCGTVREAAVPLTTDPVLDLPRPLRTRVVAGQFELRRHVDLVAVAIHLDARRRRVSGHRWRLVDAHPVAYGHSYVAAEPVLDTVDGDDLLARGRIG